MYVPETLLLLPPQALRPAASTAASVTTATQARSARRALAPIPWLPVLCMIPPVTAVAGAPLALAHGMLLSEDSRGMPCDLRVSLAPVTGGPPRAAAPCRWFRRDAQRRCCLHTISHSE